MKCILISKKPHYVDHLTPIYIQLLYNKLYFAGELLPITYIITDKYNNTIPYNSKYFSNEIQLYLENEILGTVSIPLDKQTGNCDICEKGIYFSSIIIDNVGESFNLSVIEKNNLLFTKNISINVVKCPSGFGTNEFGTQCQICLKGYFKLSNSNTKCLVCNKNINYGVNCNGGDEIIIKYNYWMNINNNNNTIISGICPYGYCCLIENG